MADLKPCPFCGHTAEYLIQSTSVSGNTRGWMFGIRCKYCGVTSAKRNFILEVNLGSDGQIHILRDERAEAEEAWNRRASDACT